MLPIFLIWNLKITRRQRFALCGIFGLGLVTTICGILRTYYAAYVYYYTYDITYRAYYGWVTTVLEAQLGLIAASAPALKVFFQRYFKMSSSRAGYTAASSRHTPNMPSSNSRGYPLSNKLASQHSMTRSKIEGGGVYDTEVPLNGIKVSQGLDVHIEERDDISQKSYASTRNLTSGSGEGWGGKEGWIEGCKTVCKAVTSGVRDASRSRSRERECDAERGGPAV
ncbi:hypothetical protein NX059_010372 [Plenodomus lindquistii]|nr:hypothetical protein NX059_010372 [Plenodomus lindquistii]